MEQEFDDIALDMDPDSIPLNANGAPIKTDSPTAATIANWTKIAYDDANNEGKLEHAKKFLSLHNRAIEQTKIEDINTEISRFYFRSYQLQSAEINIKTIANLNGEKGHTEAEQFIDSSIDRISSLVQDAITSAYGRVTSTLSTFKDKLVIFKKYANEILPNIKQKIGGANSELKQKFVRSFNEVIDYLSRIFSELITMMFSFVDLINKIAKSKGYKFKDVNISFDPPSIDSITILGFSVPFPKASLPKLSISFDMLQSEDKPSEPNERYGDRW